MGGEAFRRRLFDRRMKSFERTLKPSGDSWVEGQYSIVETDDGYQAIDLETGELKPAAMGQVSGLKDGTVIFVSEME